MQRLTAPAALAPLLLATAVGTAQEPTLALVGGRVLDGYGGPAIEDGVVLVAGERIVAVGAASAERWDALYGERNEEVMAIAAGQLLRAGVTCARDLGGPLDELVTTRRRIEAGEIPGPRLFISGPFLQRAAYAPWQEDYRWGIDGPDDARAKTQRLVDAGADAVKLIDQDRLTAEEVAAIVGTAHAAGVPVVAHAHRTDEIRVGLEHGVDNFEHTGLGTGPGYAEDVLQALGERNTGVFWTPTISPLYVMRYTGEIFPERLDDPSWREGMPPEMAREIRASLAHIPRLTDSTWRKMAKWVDLGVPPTEVIQAATLWPARFFGADDDFGALAPGLAAT